MAMKVTQYTWTNGDETDTIHMAIKLTQYTWTDGDETDTIHMDKWR